MTQLEKWAIEKIIDALAKAKELYHQSDVITGAEFREVTKSFMSSKSIEVSVKANNEINGAVDGLRALLENDE